MRLALVWLLLELAGAAQVRHPAGGTRLAAWVRLVGGPVVAAAEKVSTTLDTGFRAVAEATRLAAENRRLEVELERVSARLVLLEDDLVAAREAAAILPLANRYDARTVVGRVAFRDMAAGRMELRLAAQEGVAGDTPVVAIGGVLGRVVTGDRRRCWVELVTHPASAVAVRSERGDFDGLAVGGAGRQLTIEFVPRTAEVLRGDLLETSGADGVYPPGLPVAQVIAVEESAGPFLRIAARPTTDPLAARVALLLVGWASDRGAVPP